MASPGHTRLPRLEAVDYLPAHDEGPRSAGKLNCKHFLDRIGAVAVLVLVAPVLAVAALVVKLSGNGPVLVRERRIARDGRSFTMLGLQPLPLLRRWSVDRLPELVNVVRGEMSFVGPRPEPPEFVELFGANLRRHDGPRRVKPGIAGWAQLRALHGKAPLAERVRWDDWYVDNWSLGLDARIVLRTIRDAIRDADADADADAA
jgi:lipopolysaccharide/colanic/teichoic acid biosynthesis glycosyltransferase